jgi:predicted acetyltransferase
VTTLPIDRIARTAGDTEIRPVGPGDRDFPQAMALMLEAYASFFDRPPDLIEEIERLRRTVAEMPTLYWAGGYRNGRLAGVMRLHDFEMRVRGTNVLAGGVGGVAVSLEHKRRGVARDLIVGYTSFYRERGAPFALLHPFRTDFYHDFGFGYGAKMDRYSFALQALPATGRRERVRVLSGAGDVAAMTECYGRVQAVTNGLLVKDLHAMRRFLADKTMLTFGYVEEGTLRGYVAFAVDPAASGVMNRNEITVRELLYETPAALAALLSFLRSQSDQFSRVNLPTQEPAFHFASADPRDGSDRTLAAPAYHSVNGQGLGIMYRVLDVGGMFAALSGERFGTLSGVVRFTIGDDIFAENNGSHTYRFSDGSAEKADAAPDVEVRLQIADFSSLIMGSVALRSLVLFGRAALSDESWLGRLDGAFATAAPRCMTRF